jgi:hypothetical protein
VDTTPPPAPAAEDRIEAMRQATDKALEAVTRPCPPMLTVAELAARARRPVHGGYPEAPPKRTTQAPTFGLGPIARALLGRGRKA